jgi:hypothetical protein
VIRTTVRPRAESQLRIGGNVEWRLYNPLNGHEDVFRQKNLVVTTGIELMRDLLGGIAHRPSHIGLGTGSTPVIPADTAIEMEEFRGEIVRRDNLATGIEFQLFLGLNDGNGFTYTEAGLLETGFQNSGAGDPAILVARVVSPVDFTQVAKNNSVELTVTWQILITAS